MSVKLTNCREVTQLTTGKISNVKDTHCVNCTRKKITVTFGAGEYILNLIKLLQVSAVDSAQLKNWHKRDQTGINENGNLTI